MPIGMILRNPLPGAAVDAGGGALTDIGISNDMVEGFAESFESDCSALFMLVRKGAQGDGGQGARTVLGAHGYGQGIAGFVNQGQAKRHRVRQSRARS